MARIGLSMTLYEAYSRINDNIINMKSSVITACAEIERYFRIGLNYDMSKEIDSTNWIRVSQSYAFLSSMTMEQFNRFLELFKEVRDINAHLHLCYKIYIDEDILDYLTYILPPDYIVAKNGELTVYGQAYILFFLIQKNHLFPFICSFFRFGAIEEISGLKGAEKCNFNPGIQHVAQQVCCSAPYIYPKGNINKEEYVFQNSLFRSYMTKFVYHVENALTNTKRTFETAWSIKQIMGKSRLFQNNKDICNLIGFLRNCWVHGISLNEMVEYEGKKISFTHEFIFLSFLKIKEYMSHHFEFDPVLDEIITFAQDSLNYYFLRLIEVSFKLLDGKLLKAEKVDVRIKATLKAINRICGVDNDYYEMAEELLGNRDFSFVLNPSKFTDTLPRKLKTYNLQIVEFESEDGFDIGEFHSDSKQMVLVNLNMAFDFQNRINGKYLSEYKLIEKRRLANRIIIYSAKIQYEYFA